jgi:Carbohydrate family 9 binding domain-like
MKTRVSILFILLLAVLTAQSQNKSVEAVKTLQVPKIDGNLDDVAWTNAPVLTGFIQNSPNVGAPATQKTEVRIIYDNAAIYIGAYLYDDPSQIRKQFTARDDEGRKDVDYFSVFFDTYGDKQNGFQFLVTSANVQTDARLSPGKQYGTAR